MPVERSGELTFKGAPLTLLGPRLKAGDPAPDFTVIDGTLAPVSLADFAGKPCIFSVIPSIDTGVCDAQTRKFNEAVAVFGDKIAACTVSADLPFAQARWCGAAGVSNLKMLSDHRDMSFADAYGVHIKELRLDSRSVFIVDAKGKLAYVEYVPEVTQHPDYDAALAALKQLVG